MWRWQAGHRIMFSLRKFLLCCSALRQYHIFTTGTSFREAVINPTFVHCDQEKNARVVHAEWKIKLPCNFTSFSFPEPKGLTWSLNPFPSNWEGKGGIISLTKWKLPAYICPRQKAEQWVFLWAWLARGKKSTSCTSLHASAHPAGAK